MGWGGGGEGWGREVERGGKGRERGGRRTKERGERGEGGTREPFRSDHALLCRQERLQKGRCHLSASQIGVAPQSSLNSDQVSSTAALPTTRMITLPQQKTWTPTPSASQNDVQTTAEEWPHDGFWKTSEAQCVTWSWRQTKQDMGAYAVLPSAQGDQGPEYLWEDASILCVSV